MDTSNLLTSNFITYIDGEFKKTDITFETSKDSTVTGEGKFITPNACLKMVNDNFIAKTKDTAKDVNGFRIGKEAVLQIIGQKGCEGILVLNCINDLGENSLVFAGVNENGKLLHVDAFKKPEIISGDTSNDRPAKIPILIERIGVVSTKSIVEEMTAP